MTVQKQILLKQVRRRRGYQIKVVPLLPPQCLVVLLLLTRERVHDFNAELAVACLLVNTLEKFMKMLTLPELQDLFRVEKSTVRRHFLDHTIDYGGFKCDNFSPTFRLMKFIDMKSGYTDTKPTLVPSASACSRPQKVYRSTDAKACEPRPGRTILEVIKERSLLIWLSLVILGLSFAD